MKRPIALLAAGLLALAGCEGGPTAPDQVSSDADDWVTAPAVERVMATSEGLTVSGQAGPLGRVVLSGPGGLAYAVGADAQGRFELRLPRPSRDTLFRVEAQSGQVAYPAPYRLLIAADPAGPTALLAHGAAARRLDVGPSLDAVDTDGAARMLSGRATPGSGVVVVTAEGSRTIAVGADGRWQVVSGGSGQVVVGQQTFDPSVSESGTPDALERSGAGWAITWTATGGGRQTTWFPDRTVTPR